MCGLFGSSFTPGFISEAKRGLFMATLARISTNRGKDSWGVCAFDNEINDDLAHRPIYLSRETGSISESLHKTVEHLEMFGHTRNASSGNVTLKNAHPFEIGKIIGAHNGSVKNHKALCKKYSRDFSVDSMHLVAHLNENRDFSDIEGYGSLEWINLERRDRIFLIKMEGGQLSIFGLGEPPNDTKVIVWASDEKHLLQALYTSDIKNYFPFKLKDDQVYCVSGGKIFEVNKTLGFARKTTIAFPVSNNEIVDWGN